MRILMVCLGNICRSPMAEGILRKKASENNLIIEIDSAGTGNWHSGENPDPRAIATATNFGVNISELRARQFTVNDYEVYDLIFAMDESNYRNILALARSKDDKTKVQLLLNQLPHIANKNVPDPWFGGAEGFVEVFKLLDEACETFIRKIK